METSQDFLNTELLLNNSHNKAVGNACCDFLSGWGNKAPCLVKGQGASSHNSMILRHIKDKHGRVKTFWEFRAPEKKTITLDDFDKELKRKQEEEEKKQQRIISIENFKNRICEGKKKIFVKRFCKEDGEEMLIKRSDGKIKKQKPQVYVCGSPYCRSEDCFKQKYILASLLFSIYFYSRPHYLTKRGDVWVHISIGDERKSQYSKEDLKDFNKREYGFLDAVKKRMFPNLKGILESDLSFDETRISEEQFNHDHGAFRPFGLSRDTQQFSQQLKEINEIAKEFKVGFNFIGYRGSKWLIDYFAQRHAGKFGHESLGTAFRYADVMSLENYYTNRYGRKTIKLFGFSRKERSWIKANADKILSDASNNSEVVSDERVCELVLVYKEYLFETFICPKCHGTKSILLEISSEDEKPPNNSEELIVYELISFREHSQARDFNKRFSRFCDIEDGKKIHKSDLTWEDKLNLLAFGKC